MRVDTPIGLSALTARSSLADLAYEQIRKAVLDGQLRPGTRLSVRDIAEQLGVSRSPVREAILRLEREGLAETSPHRGAAVAHPDARTLDQLYDLREVLEGLAARLAAFNASADEVTELRHLWDEHSDAVDRGDVDAHIARDLAFHRRIVQISRNVPLAQTLNRLSAQIEVALTVTAARPGNPPVAITEHEALLRAIAEQDAEMAESRARAHVRRVKRSLPTVGGGTEAAP